jgi:tRNA A37 threonylcarbamoyladenosine dehydratase
MYLLPSCIVPRTHPILIEPECLTSARASGCQKATTVQPNRFRWTAMKGKQLVADPVIRQFRKEFWEKVVENRQRVGIIFTDEQMRNPIYDRALNDLHE